MRKEDFWEIELQSKLYLKLLKATIEKKLREQKP